MTSKIIYQLKVVALTGVVAACAGCGTDASREKQRMTVQNQITKDMSPTFNSEKFMCMRLPSSGPDVILVVTDSQKAQAAHALLRRYGIDGSVEVKTRNEYMRDFRHLAIQIQSMLPEAKAFSTVQIPEEVSMLDEGPYPTLTCPKVKLYLGRKGRVPKQVVAWAQRMQERYGSDRVLYEYYPVYVGL